MDRTIKLLAASSVVMLTMTACAPGYSPYGSSGTGSTYDAGSSNYGGGGATKEAVTHSHGGKVHSHALPGTGLRHTHATGGGYGGGGYTGGGGGTTYVAPPRNPNPYPQQYNPGNNNGGVPHSHCGRVHSHPLPSQGLAHTHGNPACPAGSASGGGSANTGQYNNQQGGGNPQQGNNSGYDYAYGGNTNNGSGSGSTYDYSGQAGNGTATNNNSYYNYGEAGSGTNNNNSNYYDSTQPKAPSNYYDNNSNTNYDYSSPSSNSYSSGNTANTDPYASGGSSSGGSFAPNNYSGGNTYTVKRGDTVFQVMRNTGVYWKDIIRLNNLQAPNYQINPGQSLRLK
ncbi:LysM peptidoglycan-binding domain-containing protein [Thiothrix eikelboomii]|uniref:LysM peptidoglycan-binding domain-containing protein n=1 Tax=Thiothrix eikelboomii TaxID=92487 RepID=UPI003BAF7F5A